MRSRVIPAFLLSLCLAACTALAPGAGAIRIEDQPGENYLRITNASGKDAILYYNIAEGFGNGPMVFIRYRDGAGRIIGNRDGWWTPAMMSSQLPPPGALPQRETLIVPANAFVDLPRDIVALNFRRNVTDRVIGPCAMQLMLVLYLGRRSDRLIEPMTEWLSAPCPQPYDRR
jgi:hypothetical protein